MYKVQTSRIGEKPHNYDYDQINCQKHKRDRETLYEHSNEMKEKH